MNKVTRVISLMLVIMGHPWKFLSKRSFLLLLPVWQVLSGALSTLPLLMGSIDSLGSPRCNPTQLMIMAKQADAALCALGGFRETVKPGCEVKVSGSLS